MWELSCQSMLQRHKLARKMRMELQKMAHDFEGFEAKYIRRLGNLGTSENVASAEVNRMTAIYGDDINNKLYSLKDELDGISSLEILYETLNNNPIATKLMLTITDKLIKALNNSLNFDEEEMMIDYMDKYQPFRYWRQNLINITLYWVKYQQNMINCYIIGKNGIQKC